MKDNVKPGEKWEFNDEVARCFKNMLERSIPDYQSMRALSYELGTRFVKPDTLIVDAGCSTGMAVEPFVERFKDTNDFLLIDNSPAMAAASKERFSKDPGVEVRAGNLWENLPLKDTASLVLSVLSLQFMPTAYPADHDLGHLRKPRSRRGLHFCGKDRERKHGRSHGRAVL